MSEKKIAYSLREKTLLTSLIKIHKDKLELKKTDASTNKIKAQTWEKITQEYNSHDDVSSRSSAQLKRCWENLKYKSRKAEIQNYYNRILTAGDSSSYSDGDGEDLNNKVLLGSLASTNTDKLSTSLEEPIKIESMQIVSAESDNNSEINETPRIHNNNTGINTTKNPSSSNNINYKGKRKICHCEEKLNELRIQKFKESIKFQKELQIVKLKAAQAERAYWEKKTALLCNENLH